MHIEYFIVYSLSSYSFLTLQYHKFIDNAWLEMEVIIDEIMDAKNFGN